VKNELQFFSNLAFLKEVLDTFILKVFSSIYLHEIITKVSFAKIKDYFCLILTKNSLNLEQGNIFSILLNQFPLRIFGYQPDTLQKTTQNNRNPLKKTSGQLISKLSGNIIKTL
jgi:hypothetical protein